MAWFFKVKKPSPKPSILIASVLKPARDTRSYHKLGKSLASLFPAYEVHSVGASQGSSAPDTPGHPVITHTYPPFHRFSWGRIRAAWSMWRLACQLRPRVLILTAGELLPWGLLYTCYPGGTLLYDVQEDYFRNIRYTHAYPRFIRVGLAYAFWALEALASKGGQGFILAEDCYPKDISFVRQPYVLLPNKMDRNWLPPNRQSSPTSLQKPNPHFLLTGTLSLDYGLFEAIAWVDAMRAHIPGLRLRLCGHVPRESDYKQLRALVQQNDCLTWDVSRQAIPYPQIIQAMQQCDAVLMPYRVNKSVQNRIPTKFYECLALRKPMLIQENPVWETFLAQYPFQSAVFLDFRQLTQVDTVYKHLRQAPFYQNAENIPGIVWQDEEAKIREFFQPWLGPGPD